MDTKLVDKALKFAIKAHSGTFRRGTVKPYIIHPAEVASIVATMTDDQRLIAAGALHDVVEDTKYGLKSIKRKFGDYVAFLVEKESDVPFDNIPKDKSWKMRKKIAIETLTKSPIDAKIVALGDKLSNLRAIYRDYKVMGDKIWDKFHVKDKKEHEWYYKSLLVALSELKNFDSYKEYSFLINKVFGE